VVARRRDASAARHIEAQDAERACPFAFVHADERAITISFSTLSLPSCRQRKTSAAATRCPVIAVISSAKRDNMRQTLMRATCRAMLLYHYFFHYLPSFVICCRW